jgi:hypothetical protein
MDQTNRRLEVSNEAKESHMLQCGDVGDGKSAVKNLADCAVPVLARPINAGAPHEGEILVPDEGSRGDARDARIIALEREVATLKTQLAKKNVEITRLQEALAAIASPSSRPAGKNNQKATSMGGAANVTH